MAIFLKHILISNFRSWLVSVESRANAAFFHQLAVSTVWGREAEIFLKDIHYHIWKTFFCFLSSLCNDCGEFSDILKIGIHPHYNIKTNLSSSIRTCTNILIFAYCTGEIIYGKFNKSAQLPCTKYCIFAFLNS